jgi:type II restriction enzyme
MATEKQLLGSFGEIQVAKNCACPKCKRSKTLVRLPTNFKCADIICDFCGYLAQVKTARVKDITRIPRQIMGAAWGPQRDRMQSSIYFPLFLVLVGPIKEYTIFYLTADLQTPEMFKPRTPLSPMARRAGWQGFMYDTTTVADHFVRVF